MSNNKKNVIIFDMDGVLVDSEPVIEAAAIAGLKEYGITAKGEDFLPFIGAGEDNYIGGVAQKYGVEYKTEMKDLVYEIYLKIVDDKLKVFSGTKPLLSKLKENNYTLALASSADAIKVKANLKVANIPQSFFSTIISGEDVQAKKPSPEIYLHTAKQLNINPSKCIVVEDAINGVIAAKKAQMHCIAITSSFTAAKLQNVQADYVCDDISKVFPIVKNL